MSGRRGPARCMTVYPMVSSPLYSPDETPETRDCQQCGEPFTPSNKAQMCCSFACAMDALLDEQAECDQLLARRWAFPGVA